MKLIFIIYCYFRKKWHALHFFFAPVVVFVVSDIKTQPCVVAHPTGRDKSLVSRVAGVVCCAVSAGPDCWLVQILAVPPPASDQLKAIWTPIVLARGMGLGQRRRSMCGTSSQCSTCSRWHTPQLGRGRSTPRRGGSPLPW